MDSTGVHLNRTLSCRKFSRRLVSKTTTFGSVISFGHCPSNFIQSTRSSNRRRTQPAGVLARVPSLKTNGDRNAPNFSRHSLGGVKYESIGPITFGRAASIGPVTTPAAKPFKNTRRLV